MNLNGIYSKKIKNKCSENLSSTPKKFKKSILKEKQNASFNDSFINNSYSDFIWLPDKNHKDFDEFGDLPLSDSFEKEKLIKQLKSNKQILENKIKKLEREYNLLNLNYSKFIYRKKNDKSEKLYETIDR